MPRKPKKGRPRPWAVGHLRVRALKGPKEGGLWYWRAEDHHSRATHWVGWATKEDAQRAVAQLVADGALDAERTDTRDVHTVERLMMAWYGHQRHERPELAEGTVKAYKLSGRHVRNAIGAVRLAAVNQGTIDQLRAHLLTRHATRTAKADLDRFYAAWAWARGRGLVLDRPLPPYRPFEVVPKRASGRPAPGDVAKVLARVRLPWRRLGLKIMAQTGARIGEVSALTRDRCDLGRGVLTMAGKTGPREVRIGGELAREIAAFLMTHTRMHVLGGTFHTSMLGLSRELVRACKAAGVRRWTSHGFRRAAVDTLARAGVDVKTAAEHLGHSPMVMWAMYREVTDQDRTLAADVLAGGEARPAGKVLRFVRTARRTRGGGSQ